MEDLDAKWQNTFQSLTCPVCLSLPQSKPIYQCDNGHIICKSCHEQLNTCPQCRIPLGNNRNLIAENLLEAISKPCCFAKHGCQVMLLPDQKEEDHEKSCLYREVKCPLCPLGPPWHFGGFPEKISAKEFRNHLQTLHHKHTTAFSTENVFQGKIKSKDIFPKMKTDASNHIAAEIRKALVCFSYENQDFILMISKNQSGPLFVWIFGVGTQEQMSKLYYNIELWSQDCRITWTDTVTSIDDSPRNGPELTDSVLFKLMNQRSINYMVSIRKK